VYHNFDSAVDDPHNYYLSEFLNSLTLRNIGSANGLCNGTRLVVRGFQRNTIDAKIVVGQHAGKRVFLPQIPLCYLMMRCFRFNLRESNFLSG
jgi:ATP-dependent DNA helicase PIF1